MSDEVLIYAVGDVAADRPDPRACFDHVRERLRQADLGFCQLEVNLTTRGVRLPQARHTMRGDPAIAAALADAGFTVVSFASNHCMDWGPEGLFDTIAALEGADLAVVGVGASIAEARAPRYVERRGKRIGFLAYSSILPMGYWAEENRPGCAPMRAFTVYEQIEHDQPGTPARVHTFPHREDLASLVADVRNAKAAADFVAVSLHWGIHFVPAVIADYQRDVARAAIDAGADVILGHHAHILKGVEIYKGKPIFYSLGNFAVDLRIDKAHAESKGFKEIQALSPDWVPDFDSLYNFPPDSRMSMIVAIRLRDDGAASSAIIPVLIDASAQPRIVPPSEESFETIRAYLASISEQAGLNTRFEAALDEIQFFASDKGPP